MKSIAFFGSLLGGSVHKTLDNVAAEFTKAGWTTWVNPWASAKEYDYRVYIGPDVLLPEASRKVHFDLVYTAFDNAPLREDIVKTCRDTKVVIPSTYSQRLAAEHGLRAQVVPHGYNPDIYKPRAGPREAGPARFLAVGLWSPRKGWDILARAWGQVEEPASLTIKTNGTSTEVHHAWRQWGWARPRAPDRIITGNMTEEGMARLYQEHDVFVLPSRGEGFCLPALEALACGLRVLMPDRGGHTDFCEGTLETSSRFFMDGDRRVVGVECDPWDLAEQMEYRNQSTRGVRAYTWERCAAKLRRILQEEQELDLRES